MTKVGGLESLLNYMTEHFFNKDDPAINEHHYHITNQQYNEEIHNIYNVDKSKTFNTNNTMFFTEQSFNKKLNVNNIITNNITKNTINNTGNVLNAETDYPYKTYISNNYKSQIAHVGNICTTHLIVEHSITQITYISILTNIQLMLLITIR